MNFRMIPPPKKILIGENTVHCSVFDSGVSLVLSYQECKKRVRDGSLILPPVFIAKCKDLIQKHTPQICSWFNPSPSHSTIASVTHLPDSVPYINKNSENIKEVVLRVNGIIIESHRIIPHITLDFIYEKSHNLMDSLAIQDNEIEEITDDIIVRDLADEDDEEDDEEDEDDRFARVQRSLDEAREELERLRRERNRG